MAICLYQSVSNAVTFRRRERIYFLNWAAVEILSFSIWTIGTNASMNRSGAITEDIMITVRWTRRKVHRGVPVHKWHGYGAGVVTVIDFVKKSNVQGDYSRAVVIK